MPSHTFALSRRLRKMRWPLSLKSRLSWVVYTQMEPSPRSRAAGILAPRLDSTASHARVAIPSSLSYTHKKHTQELIECERIAGRSCRIAWRSVDLCLCYLARKIMRLSLLPRLKASTHEQQRISVCSQRRRGPHLVCDTGMTAMQSLVTVGLLY